VVLLHRLPRPFLRSLAIHQGLRQFLQGGLEGGEGAGEVLDAGLANAEFSQRVAEIVLGHRSVEWILLPRKAFECAVVETDSLAQCIVVAALFANRTERVA
jgi:hypothetical protein